MHASDADSRGVVRNQRSRSECAAPLVALFAIVCVAWAVSRHEQAQQKISAFSMESDGDQFVQGNAAAGGSPSPHVVIPLDILRDERRQSSQADGIRLLEIEDAFAATCRVTRRPTGGGFGGMGTGIVCGESLWSYLILTAGHVALTAGSRVHVEFFHSGYQSQLLPARVEWCVFENGTPNDVALIALPKAEMRGYPAPHIIPLATAENDPHEGDTIVVAGCPMTGWPVAWLGRTSEVPDASRLKFAPAPTQGVSGAGVLNRECTAILGIIIWKDGTAVSAKRIRSEFKERTQSPTVTGMIDRPRWGFVPDCPAEARKKKLANFLASQTTSPVSVRIVVSRLQDVAAEVPPVQTSRGLKASVSFRRRDSLFTNSAPGHGAAFRYSFTLTCAVLPSVKT